MTDSFVEACIKRDKNLRGRVKLLGSMLGEVIETQSGSDVLHNVERLRKGFIRLRKENDPARLQRLKKMIDKLSLSYNRQRQAQITKELIEIISGAEAL